MEDEQAINGRWTCLERKKKRSLVENGQVTGDKWMVISGQVTIRRCTRHPWKTDESFVENGMVTDGRWTNHYSKMDMI